MDLRSPLPAEHASKQVWRVWAKALRGTLTEKLSQQVVGRLLSWPAFQQAEHVLSYMAFGSEIDLSPLLETGKEIYLTRTWETAGRELSVHRFLELAGLEPHPYGYLQPPADAEVIAPDTIDLALIPGLCFDHRGVRLGYGRGYYDRLLGSLRPDVSRVGVTVEALFVPRLPREPWDVPMTHIVTQAGLYDVVRVGSARASPND